MIGETSSGKTTLINRILSYDISRDSFNENFYNLLPSKAEENTAFLWIIEVSNDEFIWVETSLKENLKEKTCKKFRVSESNSLKDYLINIDSQQTQLIELMKSANKENFLKKRLSLTIRLPWLNPKLKIIDFPGLSSDTVLTELEQLIQNSIAYFVYVKDLCTAQTLIENFIKLLENFSKKNNDNQLEPKYFSLVFTKKDQFFVQTNADRVTFNNSAEVYQFKIRRLINILNKTESFLKDGNIKIQRVDFLNLLFINKDYEERQFFKQFILHLRSMEKNILYSKRPLFFLSSLIEMVDAHFQERLKNKRALIDNSTALKIESLMKKQLEEFETKLKKFFLHIQNLENWKEKENDVYEEIITLIKDRIKVEEKKEMKWSKKNFIELIVKLCIEDINKILLKHFQSILIPLFRQYIFEIQTYIGDEKFEEIHVIKGSLTVASGVLMLELLIPRVRRGLAGATLLALGIYSIRNYVGLFSNADCWEDIMKCLIQLLDQKKKELTENLLIQSNPLFRNLYDKIISYKELPKQILEYKKTIRDARDMFIEQNNELSIDIDSLDIWKKVKIEQFFFDSYLQETLPKYSQFSF